MTAGATGAATGASSRRRRWLRVIGLVSALALLSALLTFGWFTIRYRSIDRASFQRGVLAQADRTQPQNFLLVGTDSRRFVGTADEAAAFGTTDEVGAAHADTILLVRTFPDSNRLVMLSFPRDLFLTIAGTGTQERINTALAGGPDQLVRTITDNFGIPINHFIEVDFRGFQALVDAIGGVRLYLPAPVRDWDEQKQVNPTGLDIDQTGCVDLDGKQALAYARSRHYQQLVDGVWKADPAGDLNRITRQQELMRKALAQSAGRGLRNPARLNALIGVAVKNVSLDDRLRFKDLVGLARQFRTIQPDQLQSHSLPTRPGTSAAGAEVLFLDEVAAQPVLDVFRGKSTTPATILPSAVRLRVEHAPGRAPAAGAAGFRLAAAGFLVDATAATGGDVAATTIQFAPDTEQKAAVVAGRLLGPAKLVPTDSLEGVDVVLTIGRDWKGVREEAPAGATAPAVPAPTGAGAPATPREKATTTAPAPASTPTC
ncbi:MAG: LCP family protein [Actinobacteria bacterium]|nr:LCP family protein [Actinomycetota bacterium]